MLRICYLCAASHLNHITLRHPGTHPETFEADQDFFDILQYELCANLLHAAFSLFILVVQGMLYSSHGDVQEQKSTIPQVALKAACGCGATCLLSDEELRPLKRNSTCFYFVDFCLDNDNILNMML
jgi:hypothetical protein